MAFHGTKEEYDKAAEAVAAGTATKEQKEANARNAKNVRTGSPSVQKSQDAYK